MWVSTKAQYGLRALVEIGLNSPEATPLKDVAEIQGISQHYLEQIASDLRRSGFIRSVRGARGGYRLARPPETITALEVVETLEGKISPVVCLEDPNYCRQTGHCSTEDLWRRVDTAIRSVLGSTTLADLIVERKLRGSPSLVEAS